MKLPCFICLGVAGAIGLWLAYALWNLTYAAVPLPPPRPHINPWEDTEHLGYPDGMEHPWCDTLPDGCVKVVTPPYFGPPYILPER